MEDGEKLDGPLSGYGYRWPNYHAVVYKGFDSDTGEAVAIKEAFFSRYEPRTSLPPQLEAFVLRSIHDHPNILRLRKSKVIYQAVLLIFDYIDCNLDKLITPPCTPISPPLRKILSGIAHCHHKSWVMHRHLEPRFVLVDTHKETVKISEFADARWIRDPDSRSANVVDPNIGYRAPEVILGPWFSAAADVWSVGCIFAAMVKHKPLFHGANPQEELLSIFSLLGTPDVSTWPEPDSYSSFSSIPSCKAKDLKSEYWGIFGIEDTGLDLLRRMLSLNPKDRITAEEALKHPYFNETTSDTKMLGKRKFQKISGEATSDTKMLKMWQ